MRVQSFVFFVGILLALAAPGLAQITYGPLTFSTGVSGAAVWSGNKINPGQTFTIDIVETYSRGPSDSGRATWSSPFTFSGTGLATVTMTDYNTWPNPAFYNSSIWDLFRELHVEGTLNTLPYLFNISGIAQGAGLQGGTMNVFKAGFVVTLVDPISPGQICIEKGNAVDPAYDWLFDDPMPTFTKTCWSVEKAPCKGCQPPVFTNCPTQLTTQHDVPFNYAFHATDPLGDPIFYSIYSGPGTINPTTGEWTWDPPCDSVGKTIYLSICARNRI